MFNALTQTTASVAPATGAATAVTAATPDAASAPAASSAPSAVATDGAKPTQDVLQKVATFMHDLFAAMGQARGHEHHHGHHHGHGHRHDEDVAAVAAGGGDAAPAITASAAGASATNPVRFYQQNEQGGGLAGKLQSLMREVDNGVPATGRLADLNAAFQGLVSALHPAGAGGDAPQPTLQDFLHRLVQNIGGSGADSGAVSGSLINATA